MEPLFFEKSFQNLSLLSHLSLERWGTILCMYLENAETCGFRMTENGLSQVDTRFREIGKGIYVPAMPFVT